MRDLTGKARAYWDLTRSQMGATAALATLCGFALVGDSTFSLTAVLCAVLVFLVSGAGFALNDVLDVQRDKVNAPDRPLPSRRLDRREALRLVSLVVPLAMLLAWAVSIRALVVAVAICLVLAAYSYLKTLPYVGGIAANVLTALMCTAAFGYGVVVTGSMGKMAWPALMTFVIICCRELVKDIVDVEGDQKFEVDTLPALLGVRFTTFLVTALCVLTVGMSPLPVLRGGLGPGYAVVFAGLDAFLVLCVVRLWSRPRRRTFQEFRVVTGFMFLFGILAFFLGSL